VGGSLIFKTFSQPLIQLLLCQCGVLHPNREDGEKVLTYFVEVDIIFSSSASP